MKISSKIAFFVLSVWVVLACADQTERLLPTLTIKTPPKETCLLESIRRGGNHGFSYTFEYDSNKKITRIFEFADFDSISYQNTLPFKAINTKNNLYQIVFQYNSNQISGIKFEGKDGQGRTFVYNTKYTTNANNQITQVELSLSTFETPYIANISYDQNGNITKISSVSNGREVILIENLEFDNNPNPFIDTYSDKILMYFIIYSASTGGNNLTFFANKNNILKSRINTQDGFVESSFEYEYAESKLPIKSILVQKGSNHNEKSEENFTYICK